MVEMKGPCYPLSFVAMMVGYLLQKKEGHQTRNQVKVYKDLICQPVWEARQVLVRVLGVISSVRQCDPFRKASEIRKSIVKGVGMWRSSIDGRRKSLSCNFLYQGCPWVMMGNLLFFDRWPLSGQGRSKAKIQIYATFLLSYKLPLFLQSKLFGICHILFQILSSFMTYEFPRNSQFCCVSQWLISHGIIYSDILILCCPPYSCQLTRCALCQKCHFLNKNNKVQT